MDPQAALSEADQQFQKTLDHLKEQFSRLQTGRAKASLVEDISVSAYGTSQPIKALANVTVIDSKTIQIQAWDASVAPEIDRAIQVANLGLQPITEGAIIRIHLPPMTEERRKDIVKVVHQYAEESRIAVRNQRKNTNNSFEAMKKEKKISEDECYGYEKRLQEKVDEVNKQIDVFAKEKEDEVMTI